MAHLRRRKKCQEVKWQTADSVHNLLNIYDLKKNA